MTRFMLPLLVLVDLALAGALAWLWVSPDGQWKELRWQPPTAVRPAIGEDIALPETGVEASRYVATLERPLFVPTRRAPPPASAPAAAPIDPAPELRVLGLYGSGQARDGAAAPAGGMIVRVDGKVKRVKVGEAVSGSWVFKELRPGEAVIARGGEERSYALRRAADEPPGAASADNAASDAAGQGPVPTAARALHQKEIEEARQRVRRQNALRARLGMPPLPEP